MDVAVLICARIDHNPDNNEYVAAEAARHPDRIVQFPDVDCSWSPEYHTPGAADRLSAAVDRWAVSGFTHYVGETNDGWLLSEEGQAFFAVAAERNLIASIAAGSAGSRTSPWSRRPTPPCPSCSTTRGSCARSTGRTRPTCAAERLAAFPNIGVKVSGFYYGSAHWPEYPYPDQVAIFERIYRAFGANRLTWGSDYPVSPWVACTYAQTLEVVRRHCPFVSEADLPQILGDTMWSLLQTRRPLAAPAG